MLAYYVAWHLREAWRELIFADLDQAAKAVRDPVAPALRSQQAMDELALRTFEDGTPVHSSSTLMADMATIVRHTCRPPSAGARHRRSRLSPRRPPLGIGRSTSFSRSACRRKPEPRSRAKHQAYKGKCSRRVVELQANALRVSSPPTVRDFPWRVQILDDPVESAA
ncbi:MAG: hypothetical protein M5U30_20800 [Burkholderiaceae bacterium]|nr:hypothetical protein [Burkholderiaceae bacterium]